MSNVNSFVFLLTTIIIICGQINGISSTSSSECGEHEFKCHSDGKCIKTQDVCNRKKDCADNSDEDDCDLCLAPNWHQCAGGQACISASFLCDGQEHCPDGDDEDNCDGHEHIHEKCGKYEYTCQDKACIPLDMVCDGRKQCADGSDETIGCLHAEEQCKGFFCHNKRCLESHTWVCDGYDDCGDESDEQGCAWNCKPEKDKFLCKDNDTCIPLSNVCDKVPQCPDKSDENGLCSDLKLNCQTNLCPEPSKCHQLPDTGPTCICPKGYKYDLVKRQCEDIDECQNYGICSQMCTNTNGSFECSCAEKYILKNDGRTCAVQGGEPLLLYTTQKSVVGIYLKSRHVYKIADNLTQVIGVAYDGEHIYWTNIQHQMESLVRSRQDGSEQEILLTSGIEAPEDLALDWLTGNIYFSDNILKHISVCSNNGHHCKILISLNIDQPRGIALYPQNGIMFWTDWGHKPMIGKALMDGSNFIALVTTDIHWPNCIALDQPNDRLYWVDAKLTKIESIRIDGNDRRIVLTDVLKHPYGISVFEDNLYWSDWETKSLHTCNKFTGKKHEVIAKDKRIYAVHIYHSALQPKIKNPCDKMGCSHLCLLAGNITNCACPEDMILNVDQRNCVKLVKKQKLYIGLGSYLIEMEHSTFGRHQILQGYSINVFIHNMEYNSINGTIFIADNIRKTIYEFNPFTKKVNELVNKNLGNVTSMSFDNLAQNLYWTDAERHTIEVLSLRKNQRAIVHFFVGIEKPIGLVVVPDIGKMFVALQATNHTHIDTLSLHGRGPQNYTFCTKLGNGGIQLILDEPEKDIFWLDRENEKLEFANYETYFRNLFRSNLNKPYSIALVDDDILWSSRKHQSIYWFNSKHNFGSIKRFEIEKPKVNIHSSTFDEIPLLSSKPIITSIDHHCLHNNGDCSHICVSVGKFTSACICPSGMVFKDNTNKTCIESWDCEFRCQSGECLTASRKCNGHKDCADGSDEKDCDIKELDKMKKKTCCFDQFACHDGTECIMNSLRCDKEFDCNDKSDEDGCEEVAWNCKREKDKFLCKDNDTCIPLSNVCDKVPQCPDKSDENGLCSDLKLNCQTNLCPEPSKCHQLPDTGPTCICPEGYKYDLVKRQCEDIDECQNYGICSQMCTNINGSFECSCAEKYILKNDGRTCAVQGAEPLLLYTTQKSVVEIYLKSRHVYKIADNLTQVIGVAYDGEHIYWTNIQHQMESLVRSRQDGSEQEILLTSGIEAPEDLALDWLTGNIYFSDNILKHISVCSNNGHHCKILISLNIDQPRGIALYPQNGIMFWTDWGHKPMIGKGLMDGSNFIALVTTDIHWPNCIALDQPNDRLYWVDAKLTKIESIRIDGNDRRIVLTDVLKHPYGISVFEDNLYWSDWETKSLHTCNKFTGKKHEVIAKDERIYAAHIYHSALQPKIKNPCDKMGCSHLCLLAGNITNCACPEDMILNVDQRNCVKFVKKQKLYIGLGSYLIEMEHSTFGRHQISQGYSLNVFIHNMEYNSINGTIFIADNIRKIIYEFNPFTKKVNELVNKNLGNVTSMSFDNLAQNLYWTDAERHTIEVLSLRKNQRAIVHFFVGIEKPIGLVVVPDIGKMFVALQATNHTHIDTLSLHGRGPQHYTFGTKLGNGGIQLILDEPEKDIFWLDRENEKLEFANYETYFRNLFRSNLNKPYSIALVDDDILWSSRKHQSIYWFNSKHNFGSIKRFEIENPKVNIHSSTFDEIPLLSSKPIITSIDHHCLHNNGDCSHICVSVGKFTSACICPSGMVFKDNTNKTCIESWDCEFRCQSGECLTASRKCNGHKDCADGSDEKDCDIKELDKMKKKTCRFDQFACHDGTKCIMNSLRCDKEFDCNDKSDEDGCEEVDYLTKCRNNQFGCNNGRCVDLTTVCDDFDDCGDKSDERNCQNSKDKVVKKFSKNMFQCTSGQCILKDWECDGYVDCIDGSDEHDNCASKTCLKGMVQCRLGQCIDSKLICDGHNDCGDNSDELNCESEKRQIVCGDELDSFGDPKKFQCTSDLTLCLDISAKCNKTAECPRGEDEVGCGGCSIYEFECHNKECIRKEFRCDNKKDCTDGSDEIDCDNYNSTLKNSLNFQNLKR